jgi:hypothetical protein
VRKSFSAIDTDPVSSTGQAFIGMAVVYMMLL